MKLHNEEVINQCITTLEDNNRHLQSILNSNIRVMGQLRRQLRIYTVQLTKEQKERYDKELASDGWKETDYYKKANFK